MKKSLIAFLCFLCPFLIQAQDIDVNWSKNLEYDRNSTGDMEKFVGANEKYVYSLFTPTYKKLYKTQRTLVVYDKNTMKQMGKLNIKSTVDFKTVCVTNDVVYVLTVEDTKGKEVLFAQTYSPSLEMMNPKKKVYQINTSKIAASKNVSTIRTLVNHKANSNLYIVAEKPNEKNENVELEYLVVDGKLNSLHSGQITLPVVSLKNTASNLTNVTIGNDGMLISKNYIKADRETRKEEKIFSYAILSIINPEKKSINSLPIKASGKHIDDIEYFSQEGKLYVAGIYSENTGKYSERGNGVFLSVLNGQTGELENTKFSEISAPKIRFSLLYLEKVKIHNDGKISLYATEDENIIITTRTRNGTSTTYENRKGDILVVNLNRDGSLNWQNIIERKFSYNVLYVRDVQAIHDEQAAYITYADKYRSGKRNFFNKKNKKEMRDILNFNKITTSSGAMSAQTLKLNKGNTEKNKQKYVNAANITEIDNYLFLDGFQLKFKPGVKALGCVTAPLCGIGCGYIFIKSNNGSAFKGGGHLGSIHFK
jgi:hypothetical protein